MKNTINYFQKFQSTIEKLIIIGQLIREGSSVTDEMTIGLEHRGEVNMLYRALNDELDNELDNESIASLIIGLSYCEKKYQRVSL